MLNSLLPSSSLFFLRVTSEFEVMHLCHALQLSCVLCLLMTGSCFCTASEMKTSCRVQHGKADCSHLSLKEIPPDLPRNITSLDLSHNRLTRLPPDALTLYPGLLHLIVTHNSITKIDEGLCKTLVLLRTLNVEHNEVHLLQEKDLSHCTNLTWLNMAFNRLKLKGEPFSALEVQMSVICSCRFILLTLK